MGAGAVRYLNTPRRCRVAVDGQRRPQSIGDGRVRTITEIREDWLVEDRWWTDAPVVRHYFEVVLGGGRVVLIYRENGVWMAY